MYYKLVESVPPSDFGRFVGGGGAGICGRLIFGSKPRGDGGT